VNPSFCSQSRFAVGLAPVGDPLTCGVDRNTIECPSGELPTVEHVGSANAISGHRARGFGARNVSPAGGQRAGITSQPAGDIPAPALAGGCDGEPDQRRGRDEADGGSSSRAQLTDTSPPGLLMSDLKPALFPYVAAVDDDGRHLTLDDLATRFRVPRDAFERELDIAVGMFGYPYPPKPPIPPLPSEQAPATLKSGRDCYACGRRGAVENSHGVPLCQRCTERGGQR
jgi:hypothetical protein